ncbi:MAG: hypothetical protein K8R39_02585 [Arcobacteraceae bacterium]|nr:hypothetical protein [Arcobacteraceae bacterium]
MASKNSQILLIENVLSNLSDNLEEKEQSIRNFEDEVLNLKNTIGTLKHECKTAFNEQERLEDSISELKNKNLFLTEELKMKDEQLKIKNQEFDSIKHQHEQFMNNIEKRIEDLKQQLENKNSIITELEKINNELNKHIHTTEKEKTVSISKLERKLEKEEFKNFVNTDDNYAFSSSTEKSTKKAAPTQARVNKKIQLDKLEDKLKNLNKIKENFANSKSSSSTEEEEIKKRLGF